MKRFTVVLAAGVGLLLAVLPPIAAAEDAPTPQRFGRVDLEAAISKLPATSDNALEEVRLIDNGTLGLRVFRIYHPVGRHHHAFSDTYLHILSGRAEFAIEDEPPFVAGSGEVLFWTMGTDHQVIRIIEEPVVVVAIDGPTRRPEDVVRQD